MSDSPRPVQRRRKRDSTLQAVDLLNGLMDTNTQRTASRANRPGPATPHPSRRLTYSVRRDATDMIDEFGPVSQTVPQRPRHAHRIEVTPRRSLRFSEPMPDGSTQDGSDQMLQPPKSPESEQESGDQSDEPGEVQSLEKAEEGFGDDTHVIPPRPSAETPAEDYSSSDAERDNEGDHISSQSDEEMLDGEDLASEVELFSNNDGDAHQSTGRPTPSPSSSQETPDRKPKTQSGSVTTSGPTLIESNEDTSNDQWRDAPKQPADRRDSSRSDASSTKRFPTIAVEVTAATSLSSDISKTVDHRAGGPSRDDETRTLDQEANIVGTTQHEDPPYQPSEASSSSVPSPEPSSSEDDIQHHSAEASPRSSDPPRQSTKRRHSTTSSQGTARVKNIQPEHPTSTARQQASSESPADNPQPSRDANHRGEQHATEFASQGAIARSATQDGPSQENPDQRSHGAERLEDSAWFKEASEFDGQGSNWKKLIQSMHPRNIALNVKKFDIEFEPLKRELSSLIQAYKGIIEYLASDIGPPEYDVRSCSATLETVDRQGRCQLEKAYTLSTQGDEVGGGTLVEEFEIQIFPLLVRLVLVCFEAYYVDHRLFPEAYGHFQRAMRVLLGRCNQIGGLVRGKYVACRAVSPGLRLPLKRLLESLENGRLKKGQKDVEVGRHAKAPTKTVKRGQSKPTKPTTPAEAWTDEEGYALVEGLQRFQGKFQARLLGRKEGAARHAHQMHLGPDRYYQICEFYHDGIGQRGEREVRKQSERLYHQMLPQIREMARRGEDHWDWRWLLKVVE
ncbi:hypothetical protein ASPTUDRAFT_931654 [Aspergillus tubingensis CBS 134.48]|uniref:Uncharacterized protein n=1 Tax=Aspergillus tubingensis (strain CBS 134.48) TaxID=767770 RepID=A0A1L9N117_ASPTC|nr:hypothetical protein ASPTUDRAFT_931654 [Aspergillus tubingensis CBS 134.48]